MYQPCSTDIRGFCNLSRKISLIIFRRSRIRGVFVVLEGTRRLRWILLGVVKSGLGSDLRCNIGLFNPRSNNQGLDLFEFFIIDTCQSNHDEEVLSNEIFCQLCSINTEFKRVLFETGKPDCVTKVHINRLDLIY